jgi:hypothetical protein
MKKIYAFVIACAITSLGLAQNNPNLHLRLNAAIGTGNYHTDFYFNDDSTSGVDRGYDAAVFGNVAQPTAMYSKIVDGSYAYMDFAIQSLHTSALGSDIIVPLGINVAQGQQVTVSIATSGLPLDINIYLEDNVTGTMTLLNTTDFIFTSGSTLNSAGRFFLRFLYETDQTLSTPETTLNSLQMYALPSPRTLMIKGQLVETTKVQLYDMQGKLVLSSHLETSSNANQVDLSNLSSGVYIVKLNTATQQKTQKVILK